MPVDQRIGFHDSESVAPRDDRPSDLPHLLRRVADEMDVRSIKPMDVLDLTISQEMTEDGPWWSATVYWSTDVDE